MKVYVAGKSLAIGNVSSSLSTGTSYGSAGCDSIIAIMVP